VARQFHERAKCHHLNRAKVTVSIDFIISIMTALKSSLILSSPSWHTKRTFITVPRWIEFGAGALLVLLVRSLDSASLGLLRAERKRASERQKGDLLGYVERRAFMK
jgi:hypothetical protein